MTSSNFKPVLDLQTINYNGLSDERTKSDTFRAAGGEGEAREEVTKYIQREREELALLQLIQVHCNENPIYVFLFWK
jgi:hypothetical protein